MRRVPTGKVNVLVLEALDEEQAGTSQARPGRSGMYICAVSCFDLPLHSTSREQSRQVETLPAVFLLPRSHCVYNLRNRLRSFVSKPLVCCIWTASTGEAVT